MLLALLRRIDGQQQLRRPAPWWKERSIAMHLDSVHFSACWCPLSIGLGLLPELPPNRLEWEELLGESIHLCMINKEAELSAQSTCQYLVCVCPVRIVALAARDLSRHSSLLASGVVDALLWTTKHDYPFVGTGLAEYSAGASVALIGRNESGLTLTREAIECILRGFSEFWNTASTHWRVKAAAKAAVKKIVGKALPLVNMVVADASTYVCVE